MKLDQRIDDFKRTPVPDLWPEIERRDALVDQTTVVAGWRRLVVVAAAFAIGVAGMFLAVRAFTGTGTAVQPTTPGPANGVIAYAPIGKQSEFSTINPDGSGERTTSLFVPGFVGVPSWSPDGSRIVFAVNSYEAQSSEQGNWDIYVADADGSSVTRLTIDNIDHSPAWSPDGTKIAYVYGYGDDQQIRVMNADGSDVQKLTSDRGFHASPTWSPDGSQIAYVAFDGTNANIYVVNADGSAAHRVTDDPAHEGAPAWSPDGRLIAFTSEGGSRDPGVYAMSPDGTGVTEWAHDPDPANLSIAWSPDGTKMALVSIRGSGNDRNVYLLDVASHDVSAIGRPGAYFGVSWQPQPLTVTTDPTPLASVVPADFSVGGEPTDQIDVSYLPDGFRRSGNLVQHYDSGAEMHSQEFAGDGGGFEVEALRRPEPLDLGSDLFFPTDVKKISLGGHDAFLITASDGSDEMAVIEWQSGPTIVKVIGQRLSVNELLRIAAGVSVTPTNS